MGTAQRRRNDSLRTGGQGETLKLKRPSVLWVSTDVTCQITLTGW